MDDVYLGYISIPELLTLLGEALTASGSGSGAAVAAAMAVYRSLVAGERRIPVRLHWVVGFQGLCFRVPVLPWRPQRQCIAHWWLVSAGFCECMHWPSTSLFD